VPDAGVAFTGNFLGTMGFPGMLLIGDPLGYRRSLLAMRATLEIGTVVPGHGLLGPFEPGTSGLLAYLEHLAEHVARAHEAGTPVEELYGSLAMRGLEIPAGLPEPMQRLMRSLHHLNILLSYRWFQGAR
jgi:cyclase